MMRGGVEVILVSPEKRRMGSEEGVNSPFLIRVSFANSCVSKSYANGEWFGFGVICATIFCAPSPGARFKVQPW